MEQMTADIAQETRRMELRGVVLVAGEVIAQYWPMRTFVHHNPLHSLEYLPFEETIRRGRLFLGGQGYLSGDTYRAYLRSGRIRVHHLEEALGDRARGQSVTVGPCRIAHRDVLRACLTHGLSAAFQEPLDALLEPHEDGALVQALADHLAPALHAPSIDAQVATAAAEDQAALGRQLTLSTWCDRTFGTEIVTLVNNEMIKWCEAFLDEGHATWPMPGREQGFYAAWRALAAKEWSPCGIADSRRKIARLPAHPEDAVLESLETLGIPEELRQDYLSLQLTALPGWAGFVKWRAEQRDYPWQQAYPISLVKFLAVRLWYVRELVEQVCRERLGRPGTFATAWEYMRTQPHAYFLRKEQTSGRLPAPYAGQVDRLSREARPEWKAAADRLQRETGPHRDRSLRRAAARRLLALAQALELVPSVLFDGTPDELATLVRWMDAFPESEHGPVWLKAFEAGYHDQLCGMLMRTAPVAEARPPDPAPVRPQSQSVFCIDVRSEPFRRHLEATGANETYGFAGFFAAFIRYRAWGKEHYTDQFPVIMRARNEVREIPRSYLQHMVSKHESRAKLVHAGHTLLHDLKENVVTPYVMVESLGWLYALPIVGKTAWPALYRRFTAWLRRLVVPSIATSLTVEKLPPAEIEEMVVAEQRAVIWKALRERLGIRGSRITADVVEALRLQALNGDGGMDPSLVNAGHALDLSKDALGAFVEELRREYRLNPRSASRQKERLTRAGFTLEEQVLTVETALRMMGLTTRFARLVLFCAHGSTSENNPFESALDCGACGGNEGKPNARVLAMMANNPRVRERLVKNGLDIPADTHFLAGQMDTATEEVQLFDLEDVPLTHRKDVARLSEDLREAARLTSQERASRFPDVNEPVSPDEAAALVHERSADWSQVRPEWGLSGNTAFIIGRRELTKGLQLAGRVFLHSYDYREDPSCRLLEVLLTGPQVVAQWINMEHYFSAVDNEVYGSGSKIYHNVVGRVGIMSGPWSDLRLGLAWQTVMNGAAPYHEPMRLLTVVEAPRANIDKLIGRHELLQHFYHNEWVHLIALDPEDGGLYRYRPSGAWHRITVVFAQAIR
ncbi:DUF2309 domain-containing protein [Nitrospira moscoviensis]|uniref:Probable inorganic carbon transporter subunit DabA n=1 Tax=Nitrospira moscoviensis TaxID=42253 RepID=A0A0K2GK39_NITMO|nr:DUF2309 domain-containing protein [Nitrospira moscoviensis]ALA61224.1 hypothetical protein NITMOv2_4856 [Nitrospira moscoviensis]